MALWVISNRYHDSEDRRKAGAIHVSSESNQGIKKTYRIICSIRSFQLPFETSPNIDFQLGRVKTLRLFSFSAPCPSNLVDSSTAYNANVCRTTCGYRSILECIAPPCQLNMNYMKWLTSHWVFADITLARVVYSCAESIDMPFTWTGSVGSKSMYRWTPRKDRSHIEGFPCEIQRHGPCFIWQPPKAMENNWESMLRAISCRIRSIKWPSPIALLEYNNSKTMEYWQCTPIAC